MTAAVLARQAWEAVEPIHDVVYFAPGLREVTDAAGLRGFWMAYFALRAAPLGTAGVDVVTATFHGFHRDRVARSIPDAWARVDAAAALELRLAWVDIAMRRVLGELIESDDIAEAAEIAWEAAQACDVAGRPLAAGNRALPRPATPQLALWQATTTLREHRGDGHVAVLVARRISPAQAHILKGAANEAHAQVLQEGRGFPAAEWAAATATLRSAGLLDGDGALTASGRAERAEIERLTDEAAAGPWEAIGEERTRRLLALVAPLTAAVLASGILPDPSPTGLVPL